MRSFILTIISLAYTTATFSQELSFKTLNWWNPGYPTVVNAGRIAMHSDAVKNKYCFPSDDQIEATRKIHGMEDFSTSAGAWTIELLWTLKSIDGIDYKSLSDEQINEAFVDTVNNHKFTWDTPYERGRTTIGIPSTNYNFIQKLNIDYDKNYDKPVVTSKYFQKKDGIEVLVDWDIDWSKVRTYDFILTGSDPLTDKKILEEFAKSLVPTMIRDTNAPDVFFTIAKDTESSVSYSYVPPKVDYIKTGSTTKKVYNWLGQNPHYATEDHYQKVESKGYTKEINHSEIFLEICMLDASKIEQSTPPIIYKGSVKQSYSEKINPLDYYFYFARSFGHPISQKFAVRKLKFDETIPYALRWGIASVNNPSDFEFATKEKPREISMVYRPSLHLVNGTIPAEGDIIIKRKSKNHRVHSGAEWHDEEYTYKDIHGKTQKFTILYVYEYGTNVVPFMKGDYWFRPYLVTIED